jgi:iron complex transport system substrate-binding protein
MALAAAPPAAQAEGPRRVVSLNLCTDQLALALLDRDRIASLSPLATDRLSYLREKASGLPRNAGRGETILLTGADLVLAGPFEAGARRDLLRRQGFEVMVVGLWTRLDEGRAHVRAFAKRLGIEARGEALLAAIDGALERSRGIAPPRSVLVLQRRGYTPGDTTILDELLRHMGLAPITVAMGVPHGGTVALERLVANPPDYILTGSGHRGVVDQGTAFLAHPALARVVPPERRLVLADDLTICGGPSTPAAIDALAAEIRAKVR